MAQKTITQLQLRDNVSADLNFASDDGIQSYRVTAQQIKDFTLPDNGLGRVKLAQGGVGRLVVTPVTSTYPIVSTDDLVLCSGGAFTVTLPTAVGIVGRRFVIKKTDSSFANIITIATTSSQTIDGETSTTLNTIGETLELVSDGANWEIVNRRIPSPWMTTTLAVTGAGGNPTKGVTQIDQVKYRRTGDSLEMLVGYRQNNSGAAAGSGVYLFTIPGSLSANHASSTTITNDEMDEVNYIGVGNVIRNGAHQGTVHAALYDATRYYLKFAAGFQDTTGTSDSTDAGNVFSASTAVNFGHFMGIMLHLKIPILGWKV